MKRLILIAAIMYCASETIAQWTTLPNGNTYYNLSGAVGIGTNNPIYTLDVVGMIHATSTLLIEGENPGSKTVWFKGFPNSGANMVLQGGGLNQIAYWVTADNSALKIGGNGSEEPAIGALNILANGNIGIGTQAPGAYKLAVEGKIGASGIKITLQRPWPDYVFAKDYKLPSLLELESFIKKHQHLPGLPSAQEVTEAKGVELGDMTTRLLEKIEELTLHVIEMNKKIEKLQNENANLRSSISGEKMIICK